MEQTVNTFTKGLLRDTNPMIQGTDTLTDALNATITTMNGNEIILLNDMGNRRVADAYLPAGFEPVGIKEYGGIIYVAAYNPITNLSQIGSFPSPLRKYNNYYDDEGINIELSYYNNNKFKISDNTPKFLLNDSYIELLINKPLIPGDKFLTITTDNGFDSNLITQKPDVKNKLFSLYYGILNSQNLFVDISNSLKIWSTTDHFIAEYSDSNPTLMGTISDTDFERNRLTYKMNTYSEKLVGYPYIKVLINHPINFNYSYTGYRINDNLVLIDIIGTIYYNCPDGKGKTQYFTTDSNNSITNTLQNSYKNKYGYSLYKKSFSVSPRLVPEISSGQNLHDFNELSLVTKDVSLLDKKFIPWDAEIVSCSDVSPVYFWEYNLTNNLYSLTIRKSYLLSCQNNVSTLFNGYLCVPVEIPDLNLIYLKDISVPISLDLSLFGSNELRLNSWGFKWDNGKLILRYSLNNYFSEKFTYSDLTLNLTDITNSPSVNLSSISLDNLGGQKEITGLLSQHVYTATITYKAKDSEGNYVLESVNGSLTDNIKTINGLWILTTELFNNCYDISSEQYINNYCNRITLVERDIFEKLTKIEIEITGNLSAGSPSSTSTNNSNLLEFYTALSEEILVKIKNTITKQLSFSGLLIEIKNSELYPLNIYTFSDDFSISYNLYTTDLSNFILNDRYNSYLDNYKYMTTEVNNSNNKVKLEFYDFFVGKLLNPTLVTIPYIYYPIKTNKNILLSLFDDDKYKGNNANLNRVEFDIEQVYEQTSGGNNFTDVKYCTWGPGANEDWIAVDYNDNYLFLHDIIGALNFNHFKNIFHEWGGSYFVMYGVENQKVGSTVYKSTPITLGKTLDVNSYTTRRDIDDYDKTLVYVRSVNNVNDSLKYWSLAGMTYNNSSSVYDFIKNLFPNNSRICLNENKQIDLYTINNNRSNGTYNLIENYNHSVEVEVNGSINNPTLNIEISGVNTGLSFSINTEAQKIFNIDFKVNSSRDFINLTLTELETPTYFDYSSGKDISLHLDSGLSNILNNDKLKNRVIKLNDNGEFSEVLNVCTMESNGTFIPVFVRYTSNDSPSDDRDKYKYLYANNLLSIGQTYYYYHNLLDWDIYPIKQLI